MTGVRLLEQNCVLLTGRLTRDPEMMRTPQGTAKCWFSVAVSKNYKDKATGEWKELVAFVPVVVWRDAAERCKDKLAKGSPVHIEGALRSRQYDDQKSGTKRTVLEVEARRVQFLGIAKTGDAPGGPAAQQEGSAPSGGKKSAGVPEDGGGAAADDMEEVPF